MIMQEITGSNYKIVHDASQSLIVLAGKLRLDSMEEYKPILDFLTKAITPHPPHFTLDLQNLEFLNSAGLSMLLMFVVKVRETGCMALTIKASKQIPWQLKSLTVVRRLMPEMELDFQG